MNALVLETTLGGLGLAVRRADGQVFGRQTAEARSSSQLHALLQGLLAEANLEPAAIATLGVAVGPGSFTGARVGVAVGEAWQLAHPACRVVGLSSLPIAAWQALHELTVKEAGFRVLADAAGGMVYGQDFDAQGQPQAPAFCVGLTEGMATALPVVAVGLPLVEAAAHLVRLNPEALLAVLDDTRSHAPLEAQYLKPLAYRERPIG